MSHKDINAVSVYKGYGTFYVCDGNRRLKAFQEAKLWKSDIKIKVEIIGNENDLINELRRTNTEIIPFDIDQLGKSVDFC